MAIKYLLNIINIRLNLFKIKLRNIILNYLFYLLLSFYLTLHTINAMR